MSIELGNQSPEICKEAANIGIATILSSEIIKNCRGATLVSAYFEYLLKLATLLLKHGYGYEELGQSAVTDALFNGLKNSDSIPIQKAALFVVPYLTQDVEQRKKLYEADSFSILWGFFLDSIKAADRDLLYRSVIALSNFTNDEKTRLLIASAHKTYNTFGALAECLDRTKYIPPATRLAAAGITARMAKLGV